MTVSSMPATCPCLKTLFWLLDSVQTSERIIHLTCKQPRGQCNAIIELSTEIRTCKTAICLNHGQKEKIFQSLWSLFEFWRANCSYTGRGVREVLSRLRENMLCNELELNITGVYNVQVIGSNENEDGEACRI